MLRGAARRLIVTLDMIKFQHSIFALPFALLAAVIAAQGWPTAWQTGWIVAACVFARSAAMAFNRLLDEPYDRFNPRTRQWALPAGRVSRRYVIGFCLIAVAGFVLSAAMLNRLALALSPVALAILLGYSTAKRWTSAAHGWLGVALGIAPVGAWVAVRESIGAPAVLLGLGVTAWVAGFDILYALQDVAFDRRVGLYSLPARWGRSRAMAVSALCHGAATLGFVLAGLAAGMTLWYWIALAAATALLAWEQSLVSPRDLSRLGTAFFSLNGWVSVLMFAGGLADVLARR